ncbi:MAG TPA: dienelactone hydrolase family protein, partial [Casimicrobiaceae bacterium]|nr:dienelactone hydrolase family protein [Casimicrobiaceae bacterium]
MKSAKERAMGQWIQLTASDGFQLGAYRADPAGPDKPRGGLVVAQEIFGVNSHIRSVCDGFAAAGYVAVAPALFDRYERNLDIGYTPEDIARGRELKARAGTDAALHDIAAARDEAASVGRVGVVGYCWGGFITWMSASRLPGFTCAVAYYGGGILDASGEQP